MKIAIVFDGTAWHVRNVRVIEHDLERDEKVYRCDRPISNDHKSPYDAAISALDALRTERATS
jgi:hypothetical protein